MIYTSPIESITWQAVEDFLAQQIREGTYLDYKQDWPNDLDKTIAAMANTLGGIILVGVVEKKDGTPEDKPSGIPFARGLSERVSHKILSNITPPVFPDVAVCTNGDSSKAVVVIRIPQSHQTPHAIASNRRVYLRTGNTSSPEELATLDEIEWLRRHRERSISLRDSALTTAIDRSDLLLGYVNRPRSGARLPSAKSDPYLVLCSTPYFPQKQLATPPQLRTMAHKFHVRDYYNTSEEFPPSTRQPTLLQDGVYSFEKLNQRGERAYYTEYGVTGQMFYRQTLLFPVENNHQIRSSELFARFDEFARVTHNYLTSLGYQGDVLLKVLLGSLATSTLAEWLPDGTVTSSGVCNDEAISYEATFRMSDLPEQYEAMIISAAQKVAWAYNWDLPTDLVRQYYAKHRRI